MEKIDINTMKDCYKTDQKFRQFIDRNIETYQKSLDEELQNLIAVEYYKSIIPGGCNYRKKK